MPIKTMNFDKPKNKYLWYDKKRKFTCFKDVINRSETPHAQQYSLFAFATMVPAQFAPSLRPFFQAAA